MTKWYVTVNENSDHADDPDVRVWTVSRDPDDTGWETDGGFPGYGLTKHDAEELANAANRVKMTEWQPIETAPRDGTMILLHTLDASITPFEGNRIFVGKWIAGPWQDGSKSKFVFGSHYYIDEDNRKVVQHIATATHWMPLPEPPKQEAK